MAFERLCHGAAPFLLLWWDDSLQLCGGRSFLCVWGHPPWLLCQCRRLSGQPLAERLGLCAFRVSLLLLDSPMPSFPSLAQVLCALRASPAAVTTVFAPGARAPGLRTLSEPPGLVAALDARGGR